MVSVQNKKVLSNLIKRENEIYHVEEENIDYKYTNGELKEVTTELASINLYELNKSAKSVAPDYTDEEFDKAYTTLKKFFNHHIGTYYMLLSNELKYYTVFQTECPDGEASVIQEVMNLFKYFDNIKSVELVDNGVEIWGTWQGELSVFYLFQYDKGVIRCL